MNPLQLLNALVPRYSENIMRPQLSEHRNSKYPGTTVNMGASMRNMHGEHSSKELAVHNEVGMDPNIPHDEFNNMYGSNMRIDGILQIASKVVPKEKELKKK